MTAKMLPTIIFCTLLFRHEDATLQAATEVTPSVAEAVEETPSDANHDKNAATAYPNAEDVLQPAQTIHREATKTRSNEGGDVGYDKQLIRYTFWLMIGTVVLAVSTIGLWLVTWIAGAATKRAAKAAESSNDLTHRIFVSSTRPWISLSVTLRSPLTYNRNQQRWSTSIACTILNSGNAPAANVGIHFRLIPDMHDIAGNPTDVRRVKSREFCDAVYSSVTARSVNKVLGTEYEAILFPGEVEERIQSIEGDAEIFTQAIELHNAALSIPFESEATPYTGAFLLLCCAYYEFIFDNSPHVTSKPLLIMSREVDGIDILHGGAKDHPVNTLTILSAEGIGNFAT